jgi:hypothetical protein
MLKAALAALLIFIMFCVSLLSNYIVQKEGFDSQCKPVIPPVGANCDASKKWICVNNTPMRVNSQTGMVECAAINGVCMGSGDTSFNCNSWMTANNDPRLANKLPNTTKTCANDCDSYYSTCQLAWNTMQNNCSPQFQQSVSI